MSPTIASTKLRDATARPILGQDDFSRTSELMWLPYRTTLDLLRQAQTNAEAIARMQQDFANDLQKVLCRQQDLLLSLSERYLKLLSGTVAGQSEENAPVATLDHLQGTTLATMSEIGAAVLAAQASSFETIKQHMRLDKPESTNGHGGGETAH